MPPKRAGKKSSNQPFAGSDDSMLHTPGQSFMSDASQLRVPSYIYPNTGSSGTHVTEGMDVDVSIRDASSSNIGSTSNVNQDMDVDASLQDASSYLPGSSSTNKPSSSHKLTPKARKVKDPLPFPPLSPSQPAVELGSSRDDPTGERFERFGMAISKKCTNCQALVHKEVLQTRLEKAFEPAGLSTNTSQGTASSTRRPRPELRFKTLQEAIAKFICTLMPDPEEVKEREAEIKRKFPPKTPKHHGHGVKIRWRGAREFKNFYKLPVAEVDRLFEYSHEVNIDRLWHSELIQHKWAILSAWIWHYFQDSHFLTERPKVQEGSDCEDIEPPEEYRVRHRDRTNDMRHPRAEDLHGVIEPLPARTRAHRAWNTLLEDFAPHRNYPGTLPRPGAPRTAEEEQIMNYSVAYEAWRKATQALMPRTSLTSEFPFDVGMVACHLGQYISLLFKEDQFPKVPISQFISAHIKHQYTGDPTYIPDPYDQPSQEVFDEMWYRDVAIALVEMAEAAMEFRNDKDRDSRSWEVTFRPPPTAEEWAADKRDLSYGYEFNDSIMKPIADGRPAMVVFTGMAPPSSPDTPPGKGKGKQKAVPRRAKTPRVIWCATPMLYENRSVRAGYTVIDRYIVNDLEVVLDNPVVSLEEYKKVVQERAQWVGYREEHPSADDFEDESDEEDDDNDETYDDDAMDETYYDPNDETYYDSDDEPSTHKKKPPKEDKGKGLDITPTPSGNKRKYGDEQGGTSKRQKKDNDADVAGPSKLPSSPTVGVVTRRERRRAEKEAEKRAEEERERAERLERLRDERERANEARVARGMKPLPDIDDDELLEENERPRFFHGWV